MSDPHEWHLASDREGFFIEDEYGEEVLPHFLDYGRVYRDCGWRCQDFNAAKGVLHETIRDALNNQEPSDPLGWEAGFAANH